MKYMLLIYGNEAKWGSIPAEEFSEVVAETDRLNTEYFRSGELLGAYGVAEPDQACTVGVVDGTPTVTDGPYMETKEYLGSFSVVDCESLERAIEIAASYPAARLGRTEIRPLLHDGSDVM